MQKHCTILAGASTSNSLDKGVLFFPRTGRAVWVQRPFEFCPSNPSGFFLAYSSSCHGRKLQGRYFPCVISGYCSQDRNYYRCTCDAPLTSIQSCALIAAHVTSWVLPQVPRVMHWPLCLSSSLASNLMWISRIELQIRLAASLPRPTICSLLIIKHSP